MISVDSLLYKIDQKMNKLATNEHQQIQLEDKLFALNGAQLQLIKQKVDGISIPSGLGFDSFRKRYEDLEKLVTDYQALVLTNMKDSLNQWEADLTKLDPEYMLYVSSYLLADKGLCKDRIVWVNGGLAKHADISLLLKNSHYKPSFEYQETIGMVFSDKMSIFTDGTFTPKELHISYLRYPVAIDKEGYVDFDGEVSGNVDCELPEYLGDELIDLAVQNLAMYTENASAVQSAQFRIQTGE